MKNSVVLIILDGWGIGEKNEKTNPFVLAKTPAFDYIERYFPAGTLQSAGISVGLAWNEPGNSEVSHLNIGAGRILYQNFPKISMAIKDGSFFENKVLNEFYEKIKTKQSSLHLLGLLSSAHTHSAYWHLISLIRLAKEKGLTEVYLHLFGDGRDGPKRESIKLLKKLQEDLKNIGIGKIASFSGRDFAMNRTQQWEKTKKVYQLIVEGVGKTTDNLPGYIQKAYKQGLNDNNVEPVLVAQEGKIKTVQEEDGVFFFNFKEERMRQLFLSFVSKEFKFFERKIVPKIYVATIVKYLKGVAAPFAFKPIESVKNTLSEILAKNNRVQLKIAETEKYPFVTYFLNGLKDEPFFGEGRILIPSLLPHQFEKQPELRAPEITQRAMQALDESVYDLIVINYANADLIGKTGSFQAAIKTIEVIDQQIGSFLKRALKEDHIFIISGDHGNIERLRSPFTGEKETKNTTNPVPIYLVGKKFAKPKRQSFSHFHAPETASGMLIDITATILDLLNIHPPPEITGQTLVDVLY